MEKLEDYLFDFIGIFIPGFFLLSSIWLSTIIFVKVADLNSLIDYFSDYIISQKSHFLIQLVTENKLVAVLIVVMLCYILGMLLSTMSNKCIGYVELLNFKKEKKENSALDDDIFYNERLVFSENLSLLKQVKTFLHKRHLVKWEKVKAKNVWVTIYRWANHYASKEDYSKLQVLLAKSILIRSIALGCLINLGFTVIVSTLDQIKNRFSYSTLFTSIIFITLLAFLLRFLINEYTVKKKVLSNESTIILHKMMIHQGDNSNSTD